MRSTAPRTPRPHPRLRRLRLPSRLDPFLLSLLATVAVATVLPARGSAAGLFDRLSTAGICLLFFLHGARLSPRAALDGMRHWRLHLFIFSLTFVFFPLLMLPLRLLEPSLIPHQLFVGLVFLSVLPSTVQSSIAFTSIARGNVAAAVCSASLSNLIGVALSPLLVSLLLGSSARVTAGSVLSVAGELLLPFVAGQLVRPRILSTLERHPRVLTSVDRGSVLLVVYTAFGAGVVGGIWHRISVPQLVVVLLVAVALLAVVLAVSAAGGRALGFDRGDRIAAIFCGSKKSLASGLPLASVLFPAATVGTLVLPLMLFHQVQLFVCAALARRFAAADRGSDVDAGRNSDVDADPNSDAGADRGSGRDAGLPAALPRAGIVAQTCALGVLLNRQQPSEG